MTHREFSNTGIQISALGLGCMPMSHGYLGFDDIESTATLHKAIDLGINFWDTADIYGKGSNEVLISKVIKQNRAKVFIATKFGFTFHDGAKSIIDNSPKYIRYAAEQSLKRLCIDTIDLYYVHRINHDIPIEDTIGEMSRLVEEGKLRFIGLSEASTTSILRASKVHKISALQSEYSIVTREVEKSILPLCLELGITFVAFSPLSRGILSGGIDVKSLSNNDMRMKLPRFKSPYYENNQMLAQEISQLANSIDCTPSQLSLAWLLSRSQSIVPIPGTKKTKYLVENAQSIDILLSQDVNLRIDEIVAKYSNIGPRYNEDMEKLIDK